MSASLRSGVATLAAVVTLTAALASAAGTVMEDGKVSFGDVGVILNLVPQLSVLPKLDFAQALVEVKDLTPEEYASLVAQFGKQFDLPQEKAEAVIEKVLSASVKVYAGVSEAVEALKGLAV